ncbi:hypothetical protein BH09VER1_BH09VER1_47840 [soil metagenome]
MGWAISRSAWQQGLATEAASAVIDSALQVHENLNRIEATACALNTASQRVMEKVGMKREDALRQSIVLKGELQDESWFGICAPNGPKRKSIDPVEHENKASKLGLPRAPRACSA